jgi:hypothetical protein
MKSRDVVGRKIVRVEQERLPSNTGMVWHVHALVLDNGTKIWPNTCETDWGEYLTELHVHKPWRKSDGS